MSGTPLVLFPEHRELLRGLRELAARCPVDMPTVAKMLKHPEGKRRHMDQMNRQSVEIPMGFLVTFSIEHGHPIGECRHLSMSSCAEGRAPVPHAVWLVAEQLGFVGPAFSACRVWEEELQRGPGRAIAINVVQPLSVQSAGTS